MTDPDSTTPAQAATAPAEHVVTANSGGTLEHVVTANSGGALERVVTTSDPSGETGRPGTDADASGAPATV